MSVFHLYVLKAHVIELVIKELYAKAEAKVFLVAEIQGEYCNLMHL